MGEYSVCGVDLASGSDLTGITVLGPDCLGMRIIGFEIYEGAPPWSGCVIIEDEWDE